MDIRKGAAIAASVAALLAGCPSEEDDAVAGNEEALKCEGANECKGMSECASAEGKNDCQGLNECKSMGWVTVDTAEECEDLGGMLLEEEKS